MNRPQQPQKIDRPQRTSSGDGDQFINLSEMKKDANSLYKKFMQEQEILRSWFRLLVISHRSLVIGHWSLV
jgi:hypothetical protein